MSSSGTKEESAHDNEDRPSENPWDGEDEEEEEEAEYQISKDVVKQGAWMYKTPLSTKLPSGGWQRRFVWVSFDQGGYLCSGKDEDTSTTAKVEERIPLSSVISASNISLREADTLKAPKEHARSCWELVTQEGKKVAFASEKVGSRDFFVVFLTLHKKRRDKDPVAQQLNTPTTAINDHHYHHDAHQDDHHRYPPLDSKKGYPTVVAAFLVQFVVFGLQASFPVFIDAMEKDPSLGKPTDEEISNVNSLSTGPGIILGCLGGVVMDKVGPRPLLFICCLCVGFAFLVGPTVATSYVGLIGAYSMSFTVVAGFANSPISAAVGSWFDKHLELALGIGTSGGGLGSAVLPLLAGHLVGAHGWRATWRILATFDILMLVATILISKRPLPPNAPSVVKSNRSFTTNTGDATTSDRRVEEGDALLAESRMESEAASHHQSSFSFKKIVKLLLTRSFLSIFVSAIFFGLVYSSSLYVAIPVATAFGKPGTPAASYAKISVSGASSLFTGFGLAQGVGAVALGFCGRFLQAKTVYILCAAVGTCGILGMIMSTSLVGLSISFCVMGGVFAGNWAMLPAMVSERFNGPMLGTIMGCSYVGIGVGALIGSPLMATLADGPSGWYPSLGVLAACCVMVGVTALGVPGRAPTATPH